MFRTGAHYGFFLFFRLSHSFIGCQVHTELGVSCTVEDVINRWTLLCVGSSIPQEAAVDQSKVNPFVTQVHHHNLPRATQDDDEDGVVHSLVGIAHHHRGDSGSGHGSNSRGGKLFTLS